MDFRFSLACCLVILPIDRSYAAANLACFLCLASAFMASLNLSLPSLSSPSSFSLGDLTFGTADIDLYSIAFGDSIMISSFTTTIGGIFLAGTLLLLFMSSEDVIRLLFTGKSLIGALLLLELDWEGGVLLRGVDER